jgi:membrane protease YdiL (CAAX protease family)
MSERRLAGWLGFVGLFSTVAYASNFAAESELPDEPLYESSFFVASLFGLVLMLGAALLVAIGARKRELFALRRPRSWPRAIGLSFGVLVGVLALSGLVSLWLDPGGEQGLLPEEWPPPDAAVFALNAVAVVVGAPLAEEVLFRGLGYSLLARFGTPVAVIGTAAAWGAAHGLVEAFPLIFALGVGLGLLRRYTDSIVPGMILHATFNALALLTAAAAAD